jgi:hypothetical protein
MLVFWDRLSSFFVDFQKKTSSWRVSESLLNMVIFELGH